VKYSIITFGCRVNQADSLALERELRGRGGSATTPEDSDLLIVNTCSVTATADQGARQTIRRVVRSNPDVQVVVTGCYATRRPDELRELPNVVRVVPNASKETLISDVLGDSQKFVDGDGPCGSSLAPGVAGRTAFTMRVQTGCDEQCSYCIIPTTRGAGRSRPLAEVIDEIRRAVDAGYNEIAITGVHLGSYGRDIAWSEARLKPGATSPEAAARRSTTSLESLVRVLADWPDEVLFRISSLEPMDCTPAIVDMVSGSSRLAPHFHLPLQHGCNAVLERMRRPYTAGFYGALVERIARLIPHAAIGTDMIVGFPGETQTQFEESRDLLADLPLSHVHVFPYSDRPGTEASKLTGRVDGATVRARGAELRRIGSQLSSRFRRAQAGTTRRALTVDDGWSAVTDNYVKVKLPEQHPRNEWVRCTL
jgi:threonylcarbamoyladenosine tRNA methylthiotransferase MtaB